MPPNSNYDTSTNNPFPNFHTILLTIPFVELGGGYAVQIGVSIAGQYNGKLAVRTKDIGTWGNWNIILLALSDTHITKDMVYSRNTVTAILVIY